MEKIWFLSGREIEHPFFSQAQVTVRHWTAWATVLSAQDLEGVSYQGWCKPTRANKALLTCQPTLDGRAQTQMAAGSAGKKAGEAFGSPWPTGDHVICLERAGMWARVARPSDSKKVIRKLPLFFFLSLVFFFFFFFACVLARSFQSCLTLGDPMDCSTPGSSVPGDSPGKNTEVGCHALLQGIFPTQGSNSRLIMSSALQVDSLPLVPPGKPLLAFTFIN